jgi:hypothetical protein
MWNFLAHERTGGAVRCGRLGAGSNDRPAEQLAVAALAVNGEPREVQRQLEELRHDERRSADKFPKSGLDLRWFIWLVQKSSARR